MVLDTFESQGLDVKNIDMFDHMQGLNKGFESNLHPIDGCYQNFDQTIDNNIARWAEIDDINSLPYIRPTIMDTTRRMLSGIEIDGYQTLGLEKLSKRKINPEYYYQNLKQQSGFAAEIISTSKENVAARAKGSDITTYRVDDLPELFSKNDPYVDKVRINSSGEIVETIQTKFVGKNGDEWLSKMMSSKFDKYFDGNVDKLECPKEFYDDVKKAILQKVLGLEKQLEHVKAEGNTEAAQNIQNRINKYNQLDQMVEKSLVTSKEAMYARLYPKRYAAKTFATDLAKTGNNEGLKSGAMAAGITFTVSAVDNISAYVDGEISAEKMVTDIAKETAVSGTIGYGTAFVSSTVSQAMKTSSRQLIKNVGGSCLPAAAVSFAVESYDSISDFSQGEITGEELAYDLGENAAAIAGGIKGAGVGATIGSVAGPAGTAVGGIVGGVVGCVVTSEVYATVVEMGGEGAEMMAEKAEQFASSTIDAVSEYIPEQLDNVKNAFNDFTSSVDLPFSL